MPVHRDELATTTSTAPSTPLGQADCTPLGGGPLVPPGALYISVLALAVSGIASFVWPDSLDTLSGFVWLLALIPSFLLAYHKGWEGAALGLVAAMILLVGIDVIAVKLDGQDVDWHVMGGITVTFIAVSLGAGWLAEMLKRQREVAVELAHADPLTGLVNRRALSLMLSHHFARARRYGTELTLVMLDVDDFKGFNDRFGHQGGDDALRQLGNVLRANTRQSDVSARYGGDEFLALLPSEGAHTGRRFAERVVKAVARQSGTAGHGFTISAGVTCLDPSMTDVRDLVEAADRALYTAKARGGNQISLDWLEGNPAEADGRDDERPHLAVI